MRFHLSCIAFACAASLAFFSCGNEPVTRVNREKLFTLSYGHFEDEIDLFQLDSDGSGTDTQIYMRDGMFYVANSGLKKVMLLTSFGDLLSVYYNADSNPVPSFAEPEAPESSESSAQKSTRRAIAYPFNHPTFISVDSLKRLSVVDRVPQDRAEFDNDDQVILRDVVLRFSAEGKFLDYLGQEGPGGTPFPPVMGVYTNARNETIVTAKIQSGINVYWFDDSGALLYKIPVSEKKLPGPYDENSTALSSLEKILPDQNARKLYLKIDYYVGVTDPATGASAGISYDRSCIYPFDLTSEKYDARIDIPYYEGVDKDNLGTETFKKPYEFLGMTSSGWVFLTTPQDGGYALEVMDSHSRRIHKRILSVSDDELAYNALMLSPDGIVSALLATSFEASVVWWRTDELIGEIRK